jgi:hypothetical protein
VQLAYCGGIEAGEWRADHLVGPSLFWSRNNFDGCGDVRLLPLTGQRERLSVCRQSAKNRHSQRFIAMFAVPDSIERYK